MSSLITKLRIKIFWLWFEMQSENFLHFEKNQDELFDSMTTMLKFVDKNITFEFGPMDEGSRELILSADGHVVSAETVTTLVAMKPQLPKWTVIAFRQRRHMQFVEQDGVKLTSKDIYYDYSFNEEDRLVNLDLYVRGYTEGARETYGSLAFIMIDNALGEYDVMTKVGAIEFHSLEGVSTKRLQPLSRLAKLIDSRKESEQELS